MGIDRMSTAARIDELLSKFEDNPRRYFAPLANEYRKAGDLTQAIALCREHLPKQPGHMSGHIVFGQALYEDGALEEAQSVFEAALALDPENLIALRHLGDIARRRGDALSARRWYGRVLEADPRNDDIASLLASLATRVTPPTSLPLAMDTAPSSIQGPAAPQEEFLDEPAWHTPSILGGSLTPVRDDADEPVEPELLDLDSPSDPSPAVPAVFDAPAFSMTQAEEAFGAEPSLDVAFDRMFAEPVGEAAAAGDVFDEAGRSDAPSIQPAREAHGDDEVPRSSLSDALGAFASHDPLDSGGSLSLEPEVLPLPVEAAGLVAEPDVEPLVPDAIRPAFGEGLEAIEWPDASQLAVRVPSPTRGVTPVETWPALDAAADETSLHLPATYSDEAEGPEGMAESQSELPVIELPEADLASADRPLVEALDDEAAIVAADIESAGPIDEDPPFSAAQMPWLLVSEEEREAEESDLLELRELPESPAFVTETMAELLVAQGFVSRAVGVYEELVARRPDDATLTSRLAALRASLGAAPVDAATVVEDASPSSVTPQVPIASLSPAMAATPVTPMAGFTPARSQTPRAVPFIAPAPRRTVREWLSVLAARQVARRTPMAGQVAVAMPTPADGLASLFGASTLPADDVAARSLATAFGSAVPLDSSSPLFASGEFTLPPESTPATVREAPTVPEDAPGLYSFDRFFPDPATAAGSPSASSDAAAAPPSPISDDPTSPGADLAQFSHWLKGLSNS